MIRVWWRIKSNGPTPCLLIWSFVLMVLVSACNTHEYRLRRARLLYQQGQLLQSQGKTSEAIRKFEASLDLARKEGFRAGVAHNLNELAIISTSKGDYEKARHMLREAAQIYTSLNMRPEVSKTLNNIALTYLKQGDIKNALAAYDELLHWDKATGNKLGQLIVLYNTGKIYDDYLKLHCKAKARFKAALGLAQSLNRHHLVQELRSRLSRLSLICITP